MKRMRFIVLAVLLIAALTGCSRKDATGKAHEAVNAASDALKNVNADTVINAAQDSSSLIPEVNVNATVTKTPIPQPKF